MKFTPETKATLKSAAKNLINGMTSQKAHKNGTPPRTIQTQNDAYYKPQEGQCRIRMKDAAGNPKKLGKVTHKRERWALTKGGVLESFILLCIVVFEDTRLKIY